MSSKGVRETKKKDQKASCDLDVKPVEESQGTALPTLSAEERALVDTYLERKKRDAPLRLEATFKDGVCRVSYPGTQEQTLVAAKLSRATGTVSRCVTDLFLSETLRTYFGMNAANVSVLLNTAMALLNGIGPRDEVEGMLAVQMIGAHNLALEFLRRALIEGQTQEGASECVDRATKLMRTYTAQIEALNKYRTKGQQKVTVEHVHVNAGGQAIVGVVNTPGGGGDEKI